MDVEETTTEIDESLYSRQLYVMGREGQARMAASGARRARVAEHEPESEPGRELCQLVSTPLSRRWATSARRSRRPPPPCRPCRTDQLRCRRREARHLGAGRLKRHVAAFLASSARDLRANSSRPQSVIGSKTLPATNRKYRFCIEICTIWGTPARVLAPSGGSNFRLQWE